MTQYLCNKPPKQPKVGQTPSSARDPWSRLCRIQCLLLADTLAHQVAEFISRHHMLTPGDRVGVAVSGGADSVALLHLLHRLRSRFAIELLVLHVNHGLRGEESDADEEFVRSQAASLGLKAVVINGHPQPGNIEQEARDIRRAFFQRAKADHNLHRIALGHTQSDQAETVLFRLLRGSGLAGLAGMRPVTNDSLIRPLLASSRGDVREWARAEGIPWREDSSNTSLAFTRNRIRQETLPSLSQAYNPQLETLLANSARVAQAEEEYWKEQISGLFQQITKRTSLGLNFQAGRIAALHPAVQRRLIRCGIQKVRGNLRGIDFEHTEAILKLCASQKGHDRVIIPGLDALRSFDQLLLMRPGVFSGQPRNYCLELKLGEKAQLPYQAGMVFLNWLKSDFNFCANFKKEPEDNFETFDLDADLLTADRTLSSLYVRNWQPGDELHRIGHKAGEKIKTLFQSDRILLWERRHWPVVTAGGEIIWARQFGGAARFNVTGKSQNVLRLIYRALS